MPSQNFGFFMPTPNVSVFVSIKCVYPWWRTVSSSDVNFVNVCTIYGEQRKEEIGAKPREKVAFCKTLRSYMYIINNAIFILFKDGQ